MDDKHKLEDEIIVDAKPVEGEDVGVAAATSNEPPIPAGHARFYCNKCRTVRYI